MIVRRLPLVSLGSLAALVVVSALGASAAANTVAPSNAGQVSQALLISQIAPPECAGMGLTRLQIGGGGSGGGNALIIGTAGNDTLTGGGGDAWAVDRRMDAAIVAAMRSAGSMTVSARDSAGRGFSNSWTLAGAASAMDAATLGCARLR